MATLTSAGRERLGMLELDGGDAGGQFVRTGLTLAALAERDVRIEHVRGDRVEPGLGHQHVAAVDALGRLCDADLTGAEVGAETVTFEPGTVRPRAIDVDVGTAGSISLVFDAVLPLGFAVDGPFSVAATGGTEVTWSPPLASLRRVKLPLLGRHGVVAAVERERTGFYPAGGGRATLHVGPASPTAFDLTDRGAGGGVDVVSIASEGLADSDVAERQAGAVRDVLDARGMAVRHETVTYADAASPGSAVLVSLSYESTCAGFDALGEPGKPAEDVGREAAEAAVAFHESGTGVVDRHLADQLLVYLAVSGGRVQVPAATEHVETSVSLLSSFGVDVEASTVGDGILLSVDEPLCRRGDEVG